MKVIMKFKENIIILKNYLIKKMNFMIRGMWS